MKSCMIEVSFFEDGKCNSSTEINTLDSCRVQPNGPLWPVELQLLNDIVRMLRERKDVYQPAKG